MAKTILHSCFETRYSSLQCIKNNHTRNKHRGRTVQVIYNCTEIIRYLKILCNNLMKRVSVLNSAVSIHGHTKMKKIKKISFMTLARQLE